MIVEVTHEFLENLKTAKNGYTREAMVILGVPWPPPHGWKRAIMGKLISVDPEEFERARYTPKEWDAFVRDLKRIGSESTGPFNPRPTMPRFG